MILKDIVKIIDHDHPSADTVSSLVHKEGFRQIGSGAFTRTYGKKDLPFVVKINTCPDPAAYKFYSLISGKTLRHYPKVHKMRTYVNEHGRYLFIAVVERLHHVSSIKWKVVNEQSQGFISWITMDPKIRCCVGFHNFQGTNEQAEKWKSHNSASIAIFQSVIDATSTYAHQDMHADNFMVRLPTGDIVLNDPVCTRR